MFRLFFGCEVVLLFPFTGGDLPMELVGCGQSGREVS